MSKRNFIKACREQTNYTVATSRAALDLFCEIMGYPNRKACSLTERSISPTSSQQQNILIV